jgi:hypothetical protein
MLRYTMTILFLFAGLLAGCGAPATLPTVPTHTVKGQVKLDGKPMPEGEISFSVAGQIPQVHTIKDGAYSGPAPEGKARVEIMAYKAAEPVVMDGKVMNEGAKSNYLPDKYNAETTLSAEVTASGANEFNFDVTSQ